MARHFTLEEANALLPRLREVLTSLRTAVAELERATAGAAEVRSRIRGNGHAPPEEPLQQEQRAREAVASQIRQVQELGVKLKDPRSGLVDFPSLRGGRTVYLCWMLDEPTIAYWHPVETGFAGRQPL
jgi:hypothetical protein